MSARLAGKVALVTGAASGMGAAIVRRFCAEGASVHASGLQPELLAGLARATGAGAVPCDVTDERAVRALVDGVLRAHGRLDILVSAAGIVHEDDGATIDDAVWHRILDVNLGGAMRVCRAVLPVMQRQRAGAIVNIASVAAFNGSAGMASYAASKAGLVAFTRTLANRYGAEGIRANCLAPGWVRTPMSEMEMRAAAASGGISVEAAFDALAGRIALRRIGTVEEMAACALFLASDDAAFVTGAVLVADGGARTPASARAV
jgi:NAD(P)-dependent dehydrogenase (short-subunit alcohol dehydrogenase family)